MRNDSASKKMNKFKTSPLIVCVAVLEVIILICVSTYAWFAITERDTITTEFIGVDPDSGLEIDFNDATEDGAVDINRYITDFCFEPVTSLDGRNIFVPTTGTFNNTDTGNIAFREATVNDMNSKYINIDFTLTNTNTEAMPVYLSSKSTFSYNTGDGETSEGKALRIAFYQNDGNSGAVGNDIIDKDDEAETPGGDEPGQFFIYFKNNLNLDWGTILCEHDYTKNVYTDGQPMNYDEKTGYFYLDVTSNLSAEKKLTFLKFRNGKSDDHNPQTTQLKGTDNIKFNNCYYQFAGGTDQSGNYILEGPKEFTASDTKPDVSGDVTTPSTKTTTVYFSNTLNWETPYIHIWDSNKNSPNNMAFPGVKMTKIAGNLYYHTFSSSYTNIVFNDGKNEVSNREQSIDIADVHSGCVYYITDLNKYENTVNYYNYSYYPYDGTNDENGYPVISPGVSAGFQRAYAPVLSIDNTSGKSTNIIPAFASSIDNYSYASGKPLFTIDAGKTLTMSMVIWLEGTDDDCTGDNYLGKDIDLNLIFATKDNADELYTYKFIDQTKETWLADKVLNDSGVEFNPVIQLYDRVTQKGYLMSLAEDGKTWSCKAPKELISEGELSFRRVNPLDDREYWNYWDTEKFVNSNDSLVLDEVNDGITGAVYFSAFADGAPTSVSFSDTEFSGLKYSCGGLWGKYYDGDMAVITLSDGTKDHWLKNSKLEGSSSAITIKYTYAGQTIEYKSSPSNRDTYYFVVPKVVCTGDIAISIQRYYDFDAKYALNSPRNETIKYHKSWTPAGVNDLFVQISTSDYAYWGSDLIYIQVNNNLSTSFNNNSPRVHFYLSTDGTKEYNSDIYSNSTYAPHDGTLGYTCVIPNNNKYDRYQVQLFNNNTLVAETKDGNVGKISEGVAEKNICKLTSINGNTMGCEFYDTTGWD